MKHEFLKILLLITVIVSIFFYPIFQGFIPFPGDLLVGNYAPYNTNSYEGYLKGGVPHKGQGVDVVRQLFPWKYFAVNQLRSGSIPLWNPHNLAGNPLVANFQSGVFYPVNSIFLFLQFHTAWTIYIFLIPLFAGFFMYVFLREQELSLYASIFGSVVFAFSSYMVVWLEWGNVGHTFLWLPLALFVTQKFVKKPSFPLSILLSSVLSLSLLAGYIQGFFYSILIVFFYYIYLSFASNKISKKSGGLFGFSIVLTILLTLFQTLPTMELFQHSARGNYSLEQIQALLNPVWYSITVLIPNFFGNPAARNHWFYGTFIERVSYFGFLPFLFVLYSFFAIKTDKVVQFFSALFFLALLLSIDLVITRYVYLLPLPLLSTTVPTRILSVFVFAGSILAAFGVHFFIERFSWKKSVIVIGSVGVILLSAFAVTFWLTPDATGLLRNSIARKNTFLPLGFLSVFIGASIFSAFVIEHAEGYRKRLFQEIVLSVVMVVTLFDLFYFFQRITPFSKQDFIFPKTAVYTFLQEHAGINRVWGYGSAYMETNFHTYERLYSSDGYEPLHIKRLNELLASGGNGMIPKTISRSDANIPPGYGDAELRDNEYRQRLLNILGVKYVLHKRAEQASDYRTFPQEKFSFVWQHDEWQVYENTQQMPRAFLAFASEVGHDTQILKKLYDPTFNPQKTILLEEDVTIHPSTNATGSANITVYAPNRIEVQTSANSDGMLFLSDTYFPGWNVSVDGENAKIYRAHYAFRAVPIPAGKHTVVFQYQPKSFSIGLLISSITIISIAGYIILRFLRHKHVA